MTLAVAEPFAREAYVSAPPDVRVVALYLPQFHAIPENDAWWGAGFTEWTNTRKAAPLFKHHYQPREPGDDRYYDLTDPAAREWQARIAADHGIGGFCYYHYWFAGRRLLERPFDEVLRSGRPDFPFCLTWANEPWTRAWNGETTDVLMHQEYGGPSDWETHYRFLRSAFADKRYIRIEGAPVFGIYRAGLIPRCTEMLEHWRALARSDGIPGPYFIRFNNAYDASRVEGFDAAVEFEPMYTMRFDLGLVGRLHRRIRREIRGGRPGARTPAWLLERYSYDRIWRRILRRAPPAGQRTIPGAFVDWDNTARRGRDATIVVGATPEKFGRYFSRQLQRARDVYRSPLLFVNAWNEWAEGAYLEPDKRYGDAYLEEIRRAVARERATLPER